MKRQISTAVVGLSVLSFGLFGVNIGDGGVVKAEHGETFAPKLESHGDHGGAPAFNVGDTPAPKSVSIGDGGGAPAFNIGDTPAPKSVSIGDGGGAPAFNIGDTGGAPANSEHGTGI
ncbi:hypothetical protein ACFWJC_05700 [Bacillus wiedmannii]|uniref:hypothetical protein n=1 Tax=Bacillus wiedmannii TaxID=1890302 RepID=UPI00365D3B4C